LPVNPDAELSHAVALERLELISWWRAQLVEAHRRIEHVKLARRYRLKCPLLSRADAIPEKSLSSPVGETPDHALLCDT
jgi:hypothetical protein